jgi:copper(I)-binding protein
MTRLALAAFAALAIPAFAAPAQAADYRVGAIEIHHPWTRPAKAGMNGVGYLTLVNVGAKPVRLLMVQSPAARAVTLHQTSVEGGVSSMREVTDGLRIEPGARVAFAPGGYHLMLMGLTRAQAPGGKVPLTLVFDGGRRIRIELAVESGAPKAGAGPAAADPMAGMHHDH